mmetsp:Transcript_13977/g.24720  ORF Transcript_13977/g.24720 Transcript_13977/m.24720 type:complete len:253 (-) Transcript_13977:1911-2669(-)
MWPSADPVAITLPSGLKAAEKMGPPSFCCTIFRISAVVASQRTALPSLPADRMVLPSGLKPTSDTQWSCPWRTRLLMPLSGELTSQTRNSQSTPPDTTRRLSGLHPTLVTAAAWPRSVAIRTPEPLSQMRTVLSQDALAIRLPSGLYRTAITASECPSRAASRIPLCASNNATRWSPVPSASITPSGLTSTDQTTPSAFCIVNSCADHTSGLAMTRLATCVPSSRRVIAKTEFTGVSYARCTTISGCSMNSR